MKKVIPKKAIPVKAKKARNTVKPQPDNNKSFIVGIGASAGGLEALKLFFDNTPVDSGMAFIVVQHLDPTHKSLLAELIGGRTKMKVLEVSEGVKVKRNCVYIIPPNRDLKIRDSILHLSEPTEGRAVRRPIDLFFHSLAEDQKDNAIGIILSGTGTEGTLGLKEIKAEGGIAIVQDPKSAQFSGMPQSAIDSQIADYILTPEKMAGQLMEYIKKRKRHPFSIKSDSTVVPDSQLKKIFLIIRNQSGYDFSGYKVNTISRRITKRIALNQLDTIENYIDLLERNPREVESLFRDFLIGVTTFFRDKEVFKSLEKKAITALMDKFHEKQGIRVWVCGCSTGEEAYSLAILFREALEKKKQINKVMIFASDIDIEAIEIARTGTYTESILPDISPARLARYFIRKENGYQLKKEIREMVVFAHHNVLKDPPFSKLDLITCRNLLIYMNIELQKKILPVFHYSLNNNGILVLGTSESIGSDTSFFSDFDSKNKIYKKVQGITARKPNPDFELPVVQRQPVLLSPIQYGMPPLKVNTVGLIEKYLLEEYAPPSVIIDNNNEVIYFSGNTSQYLKLPGGDARLNILKMAKNGLVPALGEAIKKVRITKKELKVEEIEIKVNNFFKKIDVIIKPVLTRENDSGVLMVIFEPGEQSEKQEIETVTPPTSKGKPVLSDLEKELKNTHDQLRVALNELDTSRENFQTTSEEYQSSNEELQSTNEELETSREELQSVNEELITVNNELQDKIEQLSQSNDDLNNLLRSIEVATLFLDRDLKIKRFTPTASKIFNLIPSDIGRPVTNLSSNIIYKSLDEDVKTALKTLAVKSTDVYANDGTWYQMRIIPYRTIQNIIEGVLITFVKITEQKLVEEKLKKSNEHLNLILENLPAVPFTCVNDPAIKFSFVGVSCEKVTGFLPEQFMNNTNFWINRIHRDDKTKILTAFETVSKRGRFEQPFRWKCADGKYKNFINYIRYTMAEDGRKSYIVGVWQEVINNRPIK